MPWPPGPLSYLEHPMGRRATDSVLLRARVPRQTLARTQLRLFEPFEGERKYGAMSDLITALLTRWLSEQEDKEDQNA